MSEARTTALTLTAAVAAVGIIARSMGGGAAAVERAGSVSAPAAQEAKKAESTLAPPGRYEHMGMKLLAASLGEPADDPYLVNQPADSLAVMVATIPDPVDSHEDWAYDAMLESLRRAHEQSNYVVDRMWLPWVVRADSVVADSARSRVREAYPGVILFRSTEAEITPAAPRYRLLYLVGEVPTAGVHPRALARALAERDLLLGRYAGDPARLGSGAGKAKPAADTLHLVGPTFTGSSAGLAALLQRWQGGDSTRIASVVTGSATGSVNREIFSKGKGFDFAATVNSDEELRRALLRDVLPGLGLQREELAILVEGSTAYGRIWDPGSPVEAKPRAGPDRPEPPDTALRAGTIQPQAHETDSAAERGPAVQATDEHAIKQAGGSKPEETKALRLSFPMNIGTLRDDYADRLRLARQPQNEGAGTGLSLSLTDGARPMETPPVASRLTAAAVDLVLDQIAHTLRSHNIRAVAIAASDVRDRLFLASELRNRLRDVYFVALENNALYLTPEYNRDLRGMVVLSSYPLVPETQLWSGGREVVPFSSDYAQGVYNAALMHLGSRGLLDYAYPDGSRGAHHPPVWIGMVGSPGLMPLRLDPVGSGYASPSDTTAAPYAAPDPRIDFMTGVLLIAILVAAAWFLYSTLGSALGLRADAYGDRRLFAGLRRSLRWTRGLADAGRRGRLTEDQLTRLRAVSCIPRAAHDSTLTPEQCDALRALARGGHPSPVTPAQATALAEVEGPGTRYRQGLLLSRRAEWGGLRLQEALYRMVFGVAVFGGLFPGTLVAASALLQVVNSAAREETRLLVSPHAALAVAAAGMLLLAGCAVAGALQVRPRGGDGRRALRPARRHVWAGIGWLCAAGIALVAAGYFLAPAAGRIAALAVALCAAAGTVLGAGVVAAATSLVRWIAQYHRAMETCGEERHKRLDLWRLNVAARYAVLVSTAGYLGLTLWYAWEVAAVAVAEDPVPFALLFHRGWRLDGGMSPILPLLLSAAAFAAWSRWHLRRVRAQRHVTSFEAACLELDATHDPAKNDRDAADGPAEWSTALPRRAVEGVRQVRDRLSRLVPDGGAAVLALGLGLASLCVVLSRYRAVEHLAGFGASFDALYRFGLIAMVATTAWAVYRLLAVWSGLRRTLHAMSGTPLITAFERLPRRVARLTRLAFLGVPRSSVVAPVAATQWRHLKALSEALVNRNAVRVMKVVGAAPVPAGVAGEAASPQPSGEAEPVPAGASRIHGALITLPMPSPAAVAEQDLRDGVLAYAGLAQPAAGLGRWGQEEAVGGNFVQLAAVLQAYWDREPAPAEVESVKKQMEKAELGEGPSTSGRIRRTAGDELALWVRAAEEFAAVQVVDYLESVINQMRVLALFIFASLILVTLHAGAYPYEPQSLMKLILFALLAVTVGALVKVMVEMNRDDVLSRIAHTEPGKITWDLHFVMNLVVFGLVPLISLIGSEFPAVREFLLSWVYPVTRLAGGGG
ncbi:MAG TPA: hypothetical protein VF092_03130 [Longimicrobium sp.]